MNKRKILSEDEIKHLAKLANLSLTSEELKKYSEQLEETIESVENLNKLKTDKTNPTSHSIHQENVFFEDGEKTDRNLPIQDVIDNAETKNNFFVVKRIME